MLNLIIEPKNEPETNKDESELLQEMVHNIMNSVDVMSTDKVWEATDEYDEALIYYLDCLSGIEERAERRILKSYVKFRRMLFKELGGGTSIDKRNGVVTK